MRLLDASVALLILFYAIMPGREIYWRSRERQRWLSVADQSWIGGAEIVVEGKTYWLHDPVEETWSPDRSVVQRRAKAQQSQTNRKVWLKQVQVLRSTSTANTLRNALRKEGRLLEELEQERRRDFPRLLTSHSTEQGVIVVYDSTQGSPLTQAFGSKDAPLDAFSARALLQSMHSLCAALGILHRRHLTHRALTPETILLQDGRRAMLQDVGLATRTFELGEGPELYRAPEQIRRMQDLAVPGPDKETRQKLYFEAFHSQSLLREHYGNNLQIFSDLEADEITQAYKGYQFHRLFSLRPWEPVKLKLWSYFHWRQCSIESC